MSLVSSPLGWTFHLAVRHATKGDRHRHICSIFGRLVPKVDIGVKEQNSSGWELCFDIQLATVSFIYQYHSKLLNLQLLA